MSKNRKRADVPTSMSVRKDPIRAGLMVLMGVCLAAAGAIALAMPLPYADELSYKIWIGGFGTVGGIALACWGIRTLTVDKFLVSIDDAGIHDHSNWMSPGLIRWDEMGSVYVLEMKSGSFLCIEPLDLDALLARVPKRAARLIKANKDTGFPPVRIQFASFTKTYSTDEAMEVVQRLHPELARKKKRLKMPKVSLSKATA